MRRAPVQQPRVPVFIGGTWPRQGPARRAARWDGSVLHAGTAWEQPPDPAVIAEMRAFFQAPGGNPGGRTNRSTWWPGDQPQLIRARPATSSAPSPMPGRRGGTSASPSTSWPGPPRFVPASSKARRASPERQPQNLHANQATQNVPFGPASITGPRTKIAAHNRRRCALRRCVPRSRGVRRGRTWLARRPLHGRVGPPRRPGSRKRSQSTTGVARACGWARPCALLRQGGQSSAPTGWTQPLLMPIGGHLWTCRRGRAEDSSAGLLDLKCAARLGCGRPPDGKEQM
jgi:hypothetical protein